MAKPDEGSFVRWQSITIAHFGYAVNVILTLATASLGFALVVIRDKEFAPELCGKGFFLTALLLLVVSPAFGIACTINRLTDFRKTTRLAKDREQLKRAGLTDDQIDEHLQPRRNEVRTLGGRTWTFFYWQIGAFAAGDLALFIGCAIVLRQRIF